jgi:hypothetical protein
MLILDINKNIQLDTFQPKIFRLKLSIPISFYSIKFQKSWFKRTGGPQADAFQPKIFPLK